MSLEVVGPCRDWKEPGREGGQNTGSVVPVPTFVSPPTLKLPLYVVSVLSLPKVSVLF